MKMPLFVALATISVSTTLAETIDVWPNLAPGETTRETGEALPPRKTDKKPITRVQGISKPTINVFRPAEGKANGVGVLILPGGGFRYVVPDLEGSEAAEWLNELGITAFVLNYRTSEKGEERWRRPLQDSQRALRLLRANAADYGLDREKMGLFGFSAGGQVASIHLTAKDAAYQKIDEIDDMEFLPNFNILVYPWRIGDNDTGVLLSPIQVTEKTAPTFIVHTHDDKSSSLGAAQLYIDLKKANVSAELHVYQNGGHGYGTRDREGSVIGTWKERGTDWLRIRGLTQ